jgi:hypothetical protein
MPVLRRKRRPPTWGDYYALLLMYLCFVLIGPALILYALYANHRDRPTLLWPKVSGTIVQCQRKHYSGLHSSSEAVDVTYLYAVRGHHYVGHEIAPWSTDLDGYNGVRPAAFATAYPLGSTVDVYYEPQQPDQAVLLPGPDVQANRNFIYAGCGFLLCGLFLVTMNFNRLGATKSAIQAGEARHRAAGPHKHAALRHGFASYEPACKLKLNIFPDQHCLDEVLGHRGKPLQDWKPEDRIIDVAGGEYRLVKEPDKKVYDLSPTGETWTYERLLGVAEEDERAAKKNPEALRRLLDEVAETDRMGVLMKALDEKSQMPRWFETAFLAFLVLFAFGCASLSVVIFEWVANHWPL